MLTIRNSVFKEKPVKKLTERYVELYKIKEVVSKNTVKLKLLTSMRIHLVVNISRIEQYSKPIKKQRVKEPKPVKVDKIEEWKVEKFLNKWKVRGVIKYLVR